MLVESDGIVFGHCLMSRARESPSCFSRRHCSVSGDVCHWRSSSFPHENNPLTSQASRRPPCCESGTLVTMPSTQSRSCTQTKTQRFWKRGLLSLVVFLSSVCEQRSTIALRRTSFRRAFLSHGHSLAQGDTW